MKIYFIIVNILQIMNTNTETKIKKTRKYSFCKKEGHDKRKYKSNNIPLPPCQKITIKDIMKESIKHTKKHTPKILDDIFCNTQKDKKNLSKPIMKSGIFDKNIINSELFKYMYDKVYKNQNLYNKLKKGRELYVGVCGINNPLAMTDLNYLLNAINIGNIPLKWDMPHKPKRRPLRGDHLGIIFGMGHHAQGSIIVFEIEEILNENDREPHWSNNGYTELGTSNSRVRGCLLLNPNYVIGRWLESGNKTMRGFKHSKTDKHEFEY